MTNIFTKNLKSIKLSQIKRNPEQPRRYFDPIALDELKESIIKCGIINPISVKKTENGYQIIAGERRFRAANLAGLTEVPCIILPPDEEKCELIALVENIQRCDLNFLEEAVAYKKFVEEYGLKQEELAYKIGKTQSFVANKIRILKLDKAVLKIIIEHNLTERHARALLKLPSEKHKDALIYIIKNKLNVAKTEEYIEKILKPKENKKQHTKLCMDVRLFLNSINKSLDTMNQAGINAKIDKKQTEQNITYTITVPLAEHTVSRET